MDRLTIAKGLRFVEEFRKMDPEMQMQTAAVFLTVVIEPGITMRRMGDKLGLSQASCSRNVTSLSKWRKENIPGHDLVEAVEDPSERRRKIVHLTPKGKRVAESISTIIGGDEGAATNHQTLESQPPVA